MPAVFAGFRGSNLLTPRHSGGGRTLQEVCHANTTFVHASPAVPVEGTPMKKPVWLRARVEDDLRRDFKGVTKSLDLAPAEAIRLFMARLVQLAQESRARDAKLRRSSIRKASDDAAGVMGVGVEDPHSGESPPSG